MEGGRGLGGAGSRRGRAGSSVSTGRERPGGVLRRVAQPLRCLRLDLAPVTCFEAARLDRVGRFIGNWAWVRPKAPPARQSRPPFAHPSADRRPPPSPLPPPSPRPT